MQQFTVKKCEYAKEYVLAHFKRLNQCYRFIEMYDPDGVVPLIIYDNIACDVVSWSSAATQQTLAYLKRHNESFERKTPWQKEGF